MSFYRFAKAVMRFVVWLWFRLKVEGLENLPQEGGFILCSNHRTYFDPVFLGVRIRQQLYFMAKSELFHYPVLGPIIRHLGAFPVERGSGDTAPIDNAVRILEEGHVFALFPEGTRSKDGIPLRPKSGAALIAYMAKADIIPVGISLQRGLGFRSRVTVRFGKKIPYSQLPFTQGGPRELREASKQIMGEIVSLLDPVPGNPPKSFGKGKDNVQ